jgi:SlyX protein
MNQSANFPELCQPPDRFEILETKLAHLEHTVNALSDVIARQQREIDAARERLRHLAERLAGFEAPQGASPSSEETPPHY